MKIWRSFLVVPIACWTNTIGKVCDFGLSMIFTDSAVCNPTPVGTPKCTVPELLHNELVTHKRDVFSLGVIICEAHRIEMSLALARCQASGHNWVTLVPHSGLNFYQLSAEILIWSNFGSSGSWSGCKSNQPLSQSSLLGSGWSRWHPPWFTMGHSLKDVGVSLALWYLVCTTLTPALKK
jgi:serine/threonine protein kinase